MWAPLKELERRNECFMACEGYKPSFPFNQALGLNKAITAEKCDMYVNQKTVAVTQTALDIARQANEESLNKWMAGLQNAYKTPMQTKLEAAKQFLKDHPCNPGVLNRWLDSRKPSEVKY